MSEFKKFLYLTMWCSVVFPSRCQECSNVVTDFSQENCIEQGTETDSYFYYQDKSTCIPDCKMYNYQGGSDIRGYCPPAYSHAKRCRANQTLECKTNADCGRFPCIDTCVADKVQSCMAYHANTIDYVYTYYTAKFKPECDNNGYWKAKQCKGGVTGRCFCFDKKGKRLFGQALYKDANDMSCACSRRKADLEESGRSYVSFHCDSKGNYENLQCDSGLCWCVESQTGDLTSAIVPEKAIRNLPCYQASKVGSQYLRQCDSILYASKKIAKTLELHGVLYTNMPPIVCDGDGAYGAYNITNGIAQCIWRDGKRLGAWQTESDTDLTTVTCNCARDTKIYNQALSCSGFGDYNPVQYFTAPDQKAYFYCVDADGFIKSEIFSEKPQNCSQYY